MKMHIFVSCLTVFSLMFDYVFAASAATVGLYAPDRYSGIPETCLLPMDFGYCRAKVKRYYFDMRRMKCAVFYFGGCAGNVNNFKTLEECNQVCLDGYGDYDSPNDVVVGNKISGREYQSRGNVRNKNSTGIAGSSRVINNSNSVGGGGSSGGGGGGANIRNNTSSTSFGASTSGVDTNYKNTYSKYNSNNYNTNTGSSGLANVNNSGSGSSSSGVGSNNNTKIIRNRSDDNVDEYDYEEDN